MAENDGQTNVAMIDAEGKFTPDFVNGVPAMLGDDYKDMKFEFKDMPSLVKAWADNKRFVGKKLENVIQRPAKDAKPEDVAAYQKSLMAELGGVKSADDLKDINWKAGLKEGVDIDQNLVKGLSEFAAKKGYPKSIVKELVEEFYNPAMMSALEQQQAAQQQQEDAAKAEAARVRGERVKLITDTYAGDKLPETMRGVLKLVDFIGDDGLKAKIKEHKLYDNPTIDNFEKAGIPIENIMPFSKLAAAIDTAKLVGSPAGGMNKEAELVEEARKLYPDSEAQQKEHIRRNTK